MPGYVIHIAIAQKYLERHKEDKEQFIEGTIYPDFTKNKLTTHYGKSPAYTNLKKFLDKNILDNSFIRGHFLHLITDYLFYNKYLNVISKEALHNDYDILNKELIEKYEVILPETVQDKVFYKKGKPQILDINLACKIIDEVSQLEIDNIKLEVKDNKEEWNTYKNLI